MILIASGIMDVLDLLGICRDSTATVSGQQDGRGGEYYESLSVCAGLLPSSLHPQLGELIAGEVRSSIADLNYLQIYRYVAESHYDLIAIIAGIIQTILYCDFFYLYITKGENAVQ